MKTEQDPLDHHPPAAVHQSLRAIQELEAMVSGASGISGIVLRYGTFYGPGTTFDTEGEIVEWARQRSFRSLATAPVSGL